MINPYERTGRVYSKTFILTEDTDYCLAIWSDGSVHTCLPPKPWPNDVCPVKLVRPLSYSACVEKETEHVRRDPDMICLENWGNGLAVARYLCPCGCGRVTELALRPEKNFPGRSWDAHVEPSGRTTFSPSIHELAGCKSHYFIRDGKVSWA